MYKKGWECLLGIEDLYLVPTTELNRKSWRWVAGWVGVVKKKNQKFKVLLD